MGSYRLWQSWWIAYYLVTDPGEKILIAQLDLIQYFGPVLFKTVDQKLLKMFLCPAAISWV